MWPRGLSSIARWVFLGGRRCFKTWSVLSSQFPSGSAIILVNSFLSAASQRDSKEMTSSGQNFDFFAFRTKASSCALSVLSANPHHAGEQYWILEKTVAWKTFWTISSRMPWALSFLMAYNELAPELMTSLTWSWKVRSSASVTPSTLSFLTLGIPSRVGISLGRPGGLMQPPPLTFFPCNFFYDSNRKNRLSVSVTRDGRHILTYVTSSWRCHVTYVMTSYVHDGGQNTLFLPLFVNRDIF